MKKDFVSSETTENLWNSVISEIPFLLGIQISKRKCSTAHRILIPHISSLLDLRRDWGFLEKFKTGVIF